MSSIFLRGCDFELKKEKIKKIKKKMDSSAKASE
jgi:hypothetical protein